MDTLGEYLKREREGRGITLEEASKATKIRKTYLQAIEDGNFNVQSPVFMKGFLRSYAAYLGLDSAEILRRYNSIIVAEEEELTTEGIKKAEPRKAYYKYGVIGIIAVILVATAVMITKKRGITPTELTAPHIKVEKPETTLANRTTHAIITTTLEKLFQPITTPKTALSPTVETGTLALRTSEKPRERYRLLITAKEMVWLRITVDDGNPSEVLLKKGETKTWTADRKFTILSGNAGGIDLTLNEKYLGSLGPQGKAVSKVLPE